MLTVTALTNAEYVLSSVALGIDEYERVSVRRQGVWAGTSGDDHVAAGLRSEPPPNL